MIRKRFLRLSLVLLSLIATGGALVAQTGAPRVLLPKTLSLDVGKGVKMEFVLIPSGSFLMGSDENSGEGDEFPVHTVLISKPFYMGKYEVTQEQWTQLMSTNPSHFKGPQLPVETVTREDCLKFLANLDRKVGLRASLPTEAQWEYACRAGTTTPWFQGTTDAACGDYAWFAYNAEEKTHPVGGRKPNAWGLYDMTGNVWEWCSDYYMKHGYPALQTIDPTGPKSGDAYIIRGGAWGDNTDMLRPTARNCAGREIASQGLGFRCVITPASVE